MRSCSRADYYREAGWPADEGDELDPLVLDDDPGRPNIAFEVETSTFRAPQWPDPAHPQQAHLDVLVADLDAAQEVVTRHGASLLATFDDHRVYADVIGHPFCLYAGGEARARIARIVFDGAEPRALARFWGELLDLAETALDTPERVEIARADGLGPALAFQHSLGSPPRWPDPAHPQQLHVDLDADDPEAARHRAEHVGAVPLPYLGGGRAYADPAGHPFCLGD